ncbi:ScbR family autoregulator-binding transcription factor [Streptomyces sp. NPDC102441]|uniref:ScbR family autoregulator-binding transcription factor n=1 Tax=Streptomyces sp. NPDC102441 TaxID=3366176 RepID=UPI00380C927F
MNHMPLARTTGDSRAPKQDRAVRTRLQVLYTAAEMFAELGYAGTSVTGIAERVGMTKGAVYFHYKNKEAMATEVVEATYQQWVALETEVHEADLDPHDTIYALLDRTAESFHGNPIVQAGSRLQAERSLIGAPLPEPYVGWAVRLTELFTQAHTAGQLKQDLSPDAAARVVVACMFGMQHVSDVLTRREDVMDRWREVRGTVLRAILPTR